MKLQVRRFWRKLCNNLNLRMWKMQSNLLVCLTGLVLKVLGLKTISEKNLRHVSIIFSKIQTHSKDKLNQHRHEKISYFKNTSAFQPWGGKSFSEIVTQVTVAFLVRNTCFQQEFNQSTPWQDLTQIRQYAISSQVQVLEIDITFDFQELCRGWKFHKQQVTISFIL